MSDNIIVMQYLTINDNITKLCVYIYIERESLDVLGVNLFNSEAMLADQDFSSTAGDPLEVPPAVPCPKTSLWLQA